VAVVIVVSVFLARANLPELSEVNIDQIEEDGFIDSADIAHVVAAGNHLPDESMMQGFLSALSPLWNGSRDLGHLSTRLLVVEDVAVAHVIGALSGVRPGEVQGCRGVAGCMIAVSLGHLGYLLVFRPHNRRLDQGVAFLLASLQVLIAVAVAMALASGHTSDEHWSMRFLAGAQLAFDAAAVVSLFFVAVVALVHDVCGDTSSAQQGDFTQKQSDGGPLLSVPMSGGDQT
jgi:hypothetical protein